MSTPLGRTAEEVTATMEDALQSLSGEERTAYQRVPAQVSYVQDWRFESQDAEGEFYADATDAVVASIRDASEAVTRQQEIWLYRRYNYARYRLALLIEAQTRRVSPTRAREMVRWHERAEASLADLGAVETLNGLSEADLDAYSKIPEQVDFIMHPAFEDPNIEEQLYGESAEQVVLADSGRLTDAQEIQLFIQYNYSRYRLSLLADAQDRRLSRNRARGMMLWHGRSLAARDILVEANIALVKSMAARKRVMGMDYTELVAEGNIVLLQCVDNFDVSLGYKFSTYGCRAILRHFCHLGKQVTRYRNTFPVNFRPELEKSDFDEMQHEWQTEYLLEAIQEILFENKAELTDAQLFILQERFALDGSEKRRTLVEVGKKLDLTDERIRQLQWEALGKIRDVLETDYMQAAATTGAPAPDWQALGMG